MIILIYFHKTHLITKAKSPKIFLPVICHLNDLTIIKPVNIIIIFLIFVFSWCDTSVYWTFYLSKILFKMVYFGKF